MTRRKAIVSVINDLATDKRVQKTCSLLCEEGYEVTLIGRKLPDSIDLPKWNYQAVRMKLLFKSGPAFYFFFNVRLFFKLLFSKSDLLVANDLDTLYPNYLVHRLKKTPLIYDSHEIFTEVPELQHTPLKKRIWERLEKKIVPKLKYCITVNHSIAEYFKSKYGIPFSVVRNVPDYALPVKTLHRKDLGLPEHKKIIILQGAGINIQRGAEELVEAMQYTNNVLLLIIGSGDVIKKLAAMTEEMKLQECVMILGKMNHTSLLQYTMNADLGLSIDKDTNLNYRFSLPNKIFDYANAGIPVLVSRLPEIEKIVSNYNIGNFIDQHSPKHIAEKISESLNHPDYKVWKVNTVNCAKENNWMTEKKEWQNILKKIC